MAREVDKKILPEFFEAVRSKRKTFELRKDEDNIQVGDVLVLREWNAIEGFTGHAVRRIVTYVLRDAEEYGLMPGYCIIGMQPPMRNANVVVNQYGGNCNYIESVDTLTIK